MRFMRERDERDKHLAHLAHEAGKAAGLCDCYANCPSLRTFVPRRTPGNLRTWRSGLSTGVKRGISHCEGLQGCKVPAPLT